MAYCRQEGKDQVIFVTREDHESPSTAELVVDDPNDPYAEYGLVLPNGEINWNCPSLGGMASGPCGEQFKSAFSCFHYSTDELKGSDCIHQFQAMQECMKKYPDLYPREEENENKDEDKGRFYEENKEEEVDEEEAHGNYYVDGEEEDYYYVQGEEEEDDYYYYEGDEEEEEYYNEGYYYDEGDYYEEDDDYYYYEEEEDEDVYYGVDYYEEDEEEEEHGYYDVDYYYEEEEEEAEKLEEEAFSTEAYAAKKQKSISTAMSSKVSRNTLCEVVREVLNGNQRKRSKFLETVELQISLKNYDPQKNKRFSGTVRLKSTPRPKFSVCVLGDQQHCDEAKPVDIPHMDIKVMKKLNKNKKLIKKLAKKYDTFLASESLIKQIPRILGPSLNKAGKFPSLLTHNENVVAKVDEVKSTVKFQMKKVLCLAVAVDHVKMMDDELVYKIHLAVNFLVSLLKKNWQNVRALYIKSTIGKPQCLYWDAPINLCATVTKKRTEKEESINSQRNLSSKKKKKRKAGAGEMAYPLRARAALPEDPGSIPNNHMAACKLSETPVLRYLTPSHRHACTQNRNKLKKQPQFSTTMEQTLQSALEWADDIIETVQQQPPPGRPATNGEKSLQEKLYEIYVEECKKEPEAEGLRSNVNLLEKLMKREALPCLVVNLYAENQGYSLLLKDKSGSFSEPFQLPYEVEKLLEYLDAEQLPSFLIDALEKSPVNVFHHGCVIAEIRDFRPFSTGYPPGEPGEDPTASSTESAVSSTVSSPAYQTRHVLLRPTMQTLVSDVESITSDNRQWTQEEKLELESQLILATAEPLCLDPSVAVACTANRLLFNEQKMNTDPMRQCFKRHACSSLDPQDVPSGYAYPPDSTTMTPFKKQAKVRAGNPSELNIDGMETWKQTLCEPTAPPEMDMQKYIEEMPSLPFGESEPTVSAAPEVKYGCMFDYEDDTPFWNMSPSIMKTLDGPLFADEIEAPPESRSDSSLHFPPMSLSDYVDEFVAGIDTEPKKSVHVCQEPVQSQAMCPDKMPQGFSSSVCLPQPSPGKKPTTSLVSASALDKESRPPLPVSLVPISGQGSSAVRSITPQAGKDIPPAPKAATVVRQTIMGLSKVKTLPPVIQSKARSSENNPKIQPTSSTTGVNVIHVVRSLQNPSRLESNSTQVLGRPSGTPAAEGITPNNLPTREQLPGPAQRPVKPPMQLIINNTTSPLTVRLPAGSVILRPEPQKPSQGQLQQPQQIYVLIPKQHQPARASVPPQSQPVPPASSQGSNHQQLSLPAQQTSHLNIEQTGRLNTERTRVAQQTQTSVVCQVGSTQQSHRQSVRSQSFQLSATLVQQGQSQTQNVQLRIIPRIMAVSTADTQYSDCGSAAGEPSESGTGGPPNTPRS
ncbi:protein FAM48A-like protein [Cricetulus griseus]|uniref:Large ribosomal subunit protein uL1 n=2 Tax=Cricetulus griseus TaxID=10029 RepID=A0A061HZW3_CRIGR|nr:protein FAM48A-like protein [Cricetulus griseus]